MKTNKKAVNNNRTHEGGQASPITPYQQLRRSVMACMLFEDTFYESGEDIASRIESLCSKVGTQELAALAVEARTEFRIRHASLLLLVGLVKHHSGKPVADAIYATIQRADELSELMALYWRKGKTPVAAQLKKGLARAFTKFDEYQLAKYNRKSEITLRDVLFICHAKPKHKQQESVFQRLVDDTLAVPDTWETSLSAGADKKETFTRMLREEKLGFMALLRNLRNMVDAKVDTKLIRDSLIAKAPHSKALPFRFVAAAKNCPSLEPSLNEAMRLAMRDMQPLPGNTALILDVSGSMGAALSGRSTMTRYEAAGALAALICAISENIRVFAFGTTWVEIPPRSDLSMIDTLRSTKVGYATQLGRTTTEVLQLCENIDRVICITDEQTTDTMPDPHNAKGYIVNVAPHQFGVGYGPWAHIDGFSESIVRYIQELETEYLPTR